MTVFHEVIFEVHWNIPWVIFQASATKDEQHWIIRPSIDIWHPRPLSSNKAGCVMLGTQTKDSQIALGMQRDCSLHLRCRSRREVVLCGAASRCDYTSYTNKCLQVPTFLHMKFLDLVPAVQILHLRKCVVLRSDLIWMSIGVICCIVSRFRSGSG